MPRVSVLMAAYNVEEFIDQAVQSLLAQTYRDWELVAVDDGSVDSTGRRLDAWSARDLRIHIYHNERNLGLGATRKRTLEQAEGEYAAILDSDDVAMPEWLASRLDYLDNHRRVIALSGSRVLIDERGKKRKTIHDELSGPSLRWQLIFGNPIPNPSCVFRVEAARAVGGYRISGFSEDWDLFTRMAEAGEIVVSDLPLMQYRIHKSNTSRVRAMAGPELEPLSTRIISRSVRHTVGLEVPSDLVWYLFRERYFFRGVADTARRALTFTMKCYQRFLEQYELTPTEQAQVGTAFLKDVANILRCGGWSPWQVCRALALVLKQVRWGLFFLNGGWVPLLKLTLLPITQKCHSRFIELSEN